MKLGQVTTKGLSVIFFISAFSLSSADYIIKQGETGNYRWFNDGSQSYSVCCYCPIEAVNADEYIEAFQVDYTKGCNGTSETDVNGNTLYPFCMCEAKMGLVPQFIGCKLLVSKDQNVEWTCDNSFKSPNVTVYTTCEPRCTDDGMVLVNPDSQSYRCTEEKIWNKDPSIVYCEFRNNSQDFSPHVVIPIVCGAVFAFIILIVICHWKKCYKVCLNTLKVKSRICDSSVNVPSSGIELIAIHSHTSDTATDSQRRSWSGRTCETDISESVDECPDTNHDTSTETDNDTGSIEDTSNTEKSCPHSNDVENDEKQEEMPLISYKDPKQIVKVSGIQEVYRNGQICFNVITGTKVVIVTSVTVQNDSNFTIDRAYDIHHNNFFVIENVLKENEGIYNWKVKIHDDDVEEDIIEGRFFLNVIEKERQSPIGRSTSSLYIPNTNPNVSSILTIEEETVHVTEGGSLHNEAVCVSSGHTPYSITRSSSSSYQHFDDSLSNDQENELHPDITHEEELETVMSKCEGCNQLLSDALDDHNASQQLIKVCQMLDPPKCTDAMCWIGFVKFYKNRLRVEGFQIDNIKYHTKGNPDGGHMQYILKNFLKAHGFRIGHLVYYFSRGYARRDEVLSEIRKFHKDCKFCNNCWS